MEITERAPLELASRAEMELYSATFGADREMLAIVRKCPECDAAILVPFNGVWLDAKAAPGGEWGVMKLGPLLMAAAPAQGEAGSRHTLHEHQPAEH